MQNGSALERLLSQSEGRYQAIAETEWRRYNQRWLETFARPVKDKTGHWIHLGYKWHTFSYKFVPAASRESAIEAYSREMPSKFIVLSEDEGDPSFICENMPLPDLTEIGEDLYVFPDDYLWTMVFTHEHPLLGPYFLNKF